MLAFGAEFFFSSISTCVSFFLILFQTIRFLIIYLGRFFFHILLKISYYFLFHRQTACFIDFHTFLII